MTSSAFSQPASPTPPSAPPAPPSPEAAARLRAENEALTAQLQNQALREAAGALSGGAAEGRARGVAVVKNAEGHVVVTTGDGRTVTYDPSVGLDEDAVQHMIQTALEPPRPPAPPRGDSRDTVAVVAIVFSTLLLMTIVLVVARALGRRAAARAGGHQLPPDLAPRLARIEQALEAVAIEVERISESERYSARLLTERLPEPAPGNGQGAGRAAPTLDATR